MFKLLLIWRYFLKRRVAWLAVVAVAMIVLMVVVVLSVMGGLLADVKQHNHDWSGDIIISRASAVGFPQYEAFQSLLRQQSCIAETTPVVRSFGLWYTSPAELIGIRPASFSGVTQFSQSLYLKPDLLTNPGALAASPGGKPGCIIGHIAGSGFSSKKAIQQAYSESPGSHFIEEIPVTIFALNSRGRLTGSLAGEHGSFIVVDISETGLVDIDFSARYVDFDVLQKLCWMDGSDGSPARTSEIRIKLKEGENLEKSRQLIATLWQDFVSLQSESDRRLLADVRVQDWQTFRRSFVAPVENEKSMMTLVFSLLSFVAIFIIFAIFYMIVTEKIKDLGILKSVGGSGSALAQVFLGYGALIGLIGAGFGGLLGAMIVRYSNEILVGINRSIDWVNSLSESWQLRNIMIWDPEMYAITSIPNQIDFAQVGFIMLAAIASSLLGAIIPARRAAGLPVVNSLRAD
jgi:lipoprotein-releasing system permease protein